MNDLHVAIQDDYALVHAAKNGIQESGLGLQGYIALRQIKKPGAQYPKSAEYVEDRQKQEYGTGNASADNNLNSGFGGMCFLLPVMS